MNPGNARLLVVSIGLSLALAPLTPVLAATSAPRLTATASQITVPTPDNLDPYNSGAGSLETDKSLVVLAKDSGKSDKDKKDKDDRTIVIGQLISFGTVTVDGRPTINGSSITSNSLIGVPCGPGNSAIVKIGRQGLVEIRPGARIRLSFSDGFVGGELMDGTVRVRTRPGVRLDLTTPKGRYAADGQKALFLPIRAASTAGCSYDQVAAVDDTVPPAVPQSGRTSASTGSAAGSSGLSPLALAALIFGVGVAGAITIVALTNSGEQVSPTTP